MSKKIECSTMCRACMKVDGVFLPMYGDNTITKKNFPRKLADIASIEIDENDGLPGVLCAKCAYRTDAFYEFKHQVQATEIKLRKMFGCEVEESFPSTELVDDALESSENLVGEENFEQAEGIPGNSDTPEKFKNLRVIQESALFERISFDKTEETESILPNDSEICQVVKSELCDETKKNINPDDMNYVLLYVPEDEEEFDIEEEVNTNESSTMRYFVNEKNEISTEEAEEPKILFKNENNTKETSQAEMQYVEIKEIKESDRSILGTLSSDDAMEAEKNETEEYETNLEICSEGRVVGSLNDTITRIKEIKLAGEEGRVFQCTLCMKNYEELTSVLKHTVETHVPQEGPFFCVVCEKDCSSHQELSHHVNSHSGKYPYTCFVCSKGYSMKRYLKRHMSCHRELPRHRCPKCGSRFSTKRELEEHLSSHVYTGPPFACSQCPRKFNHKGNYKRHLISHLDPLGSYLPKYPCETCGKRFLNNRTLQTHIRVHTGEKPYKCQVCQRSFSQRGNLRNHEMIHSNPRNYTCEVCGKRFNQRATLKDHSLLHTGEKPYVCNVCGRAFTFSAALRRHAWSHAIKKPYGCDVCNARFLGKYDLKRHLNIHQRDQPLSKPKRASRARNEQQNISQTKSNAGTDSLVLPRYEDSPEKDSNLVDDRTDVIIDDQVILVEQPIDTQKRGHIPKESVDLLFNLIEYG